MASSRDLPVAPTATPRTLAALSSTNEPKIGVNPTSSSSHQPPGPPKISLAALRYIDQLRGFVKAIRGDILVVEPELGSRLPLDLAGLATTTAETAASILRNICEFFNDIIPFCGIQVPEELTSALALKPPIAIDAEILQLARGLFCAVSALPADHRNKREVEISDVDPFLKRSTSLLRDKGKSLASMVTKFKLSLESSRRGPPLF